MCGIVLNDLTSIYVAYQRISRDNIVWYACLSSSKLSWQRSSSYIIYMYIMYCRSAPQQCHLHTTEKPTTTLPSLPNTRTQYAICGVHVHISTQTVSFSWKRRIEFYYQTFKEQYDQLIENNFYCLFCRERTWPDTEENWDSPGTPSPT